MMKAFWAEEAAGENAQRQDHVESTSSMHWKWELLCLQQGLEGNGPWL